MAVFFTSDTHFGHKAVIDYCSRPYRTADGQLDVVAMNRELTLRWNARVGPRDTVYHLGDFAMGPRKDLAGYRKKLNGRIILIRGNHDRSATAMLEAGFDEVHNSLIYSVADFDVLLAHKPDLSQNEAMAAGLGVTIRCKYMLCGHVHDAWARQGNIINVGVDVRQYEPKTLEELLTS